MGSIFFWQQYCNIPRILVQRISLVPRCSWKGNWPWDMYWWKWWAINLYWSQNSDWNYRKGRQRMGTSNGCTNAAKKWGQNRLNQFGQNLGCGSDIGCLFLIIRGPDTVANFSSKMFSQVLIWIWCTSGATEKLHQPEVPWAKKLHLGIIQTIWPQLYQM